MIKIITIVLLISASASGEEWITEISKLTAKAQPFELLFVNDISPSMTNSHNKLAAALPSLIDNLNDQNYNMAVTNSDMSNGPHAMKSHFYKMNTKESIFAKDSDRNHLQEIQRALQRSSCLSECPSEDETPLKATVKNIINYSENAFYQQKKDTYFVYLSNEDENSEGPYWATKPGHVLTAYSTSFIDKNLYAYSFIVLPGDKDCLAQQGSEAHEGQHMYYLGENTGGKSYSICNESFNSSMQDLAESINKNSYYVVLKNIPDHESLRVEFSNNYNSEFHIVENKIYFHTIPPQNVQVKIKYKKTKWVVKPKLM